MTPGAEPPAGDKPAPFAFDGLDRVLHEKARLGILTSLLSHRDGLVFNELRELCALTDGNLSRHLQTLQEAGLVEIWKGHKGRRPQTLVRLTADGKRRFLGYLSLLEGIVSGALAAAKPGDAPAPADRLGFSPA
jgi:DNA-binding HxlR family transcriptional regulator